MSGRPDIAHPTKIATCCYCGTRAALVWRDGERHELVCASCGAPLREMKALPQDRGGATVCVAGRRGKARAVDAKHPSRPKASGKARKRRRLFKKIFEEAVDLIEDILD